MAVDDTPPSDMEQCKSVRTVIMEMEQEFCVDDEFAREQFARSVGVEPDVDAAAALEEGLNAETCQSSNGHRQWVMARAHELWTPGEDRLEDALDEAWAEAHEQCADIGHPL